MSESVVTLTIPASAEHIRLVRLVASGMVARSGFSVDDIEDLRIGVDELCALLVDHAAVDSEVIVRFAAEDDVIRVEAETAAPAPEGDFALDDLSRHILKVAVDDHQIGRRDNGALVVSLRKRRGPDL